MHAPTRRQGRGRLTESALLFANSKVLRLVTVNAIVGRDDEPGDFWGTDRRHSDRVLRGFSRAEAIVGERRRFRAHCGEGRATVEMLVLDPEEVTRDRSLPAPKLDTALLLHPWSDNAGIDGVLCSLRRLAGGPSARTSWGRKCNEKHVSGCGCCVTELEVVLGPEPLHGAWNQRFVGCAWRELELCASADHHEEAGPARTETAGPLARCQLDPIDGGVAVVVLDRESSSLVRERRAGRDR